MKKIYLGIGLLLMGSLTKAQTGSGLDSIIVEKYYISTAADTVGQGSNGTLPVGSVTYRVFADLQPGWVFQALYGEVVGAATHTLLVNTSTSFFNNQDRGSTNSNAIGSQYLKNNTVGLDSWFSSGATCSNQLGILKSEDDGATNLVHTGRTGTGNAGLLSNNSTEMGIALTTQDGMQAGTPSGVTFAGVSTEVAVFDAVSQSGNSFSTTNGAISANNGGSKGPDSLTYNRILVGQFTTDGTFHFELNVQVRNGGAGGTVEKWVASNPQAGEYTHSSLIYTSSTSTVTPPPPPPPATGITDLTSASSLLIYPNPATTLVNLEINTSNELKNAEYYIYDVIGKLVKEVKIGTINKLYKDGINVSGFEKGLYIIKFSSDNLSVTKKIIIE